MCLTRATNVWDRWQDTGCLGSVGVGQKKSLAALSSRIIGSGSSLLVVRTPGTLAKANCLVASSCAVIRHDRRVLESCLDICFYRFEGRTRASNTTNTNNGQHLLDRRDLRGSRGSARLAEVWIRYAAALGI